MADGLVREYIEQLEKISATGLAGEHSYRSIFQQLVETLVGSNFQIINEPSKEKHGAPDFIVIDIQDIRIGYIECKNYGCDLNIIETSEQLKRYRQNFPNLILTNYSEFRYYDKGVLRLTTHLSNKNNIQQLDTMFSIFCGHKTKINSPKDLAKKMANLARELKLCIVNTINLNPDAELASLLKGYKKVLIPDLSPTEFADMQAQIITYGKFTARCLDQETKINYLQGTNKITSPFIKEALNFIDQNATDDKIIWLIEKIEEMFDHVDILKFLKAFKAAENKHPIVHFYEDFLEAYDKELRRSRGVYFTPKPVVTYIVRSVDNVLRYKFNFKNGLAHVDENQPLVVLDPAVGTGTFLLEVISKVKETIINEFGAAIWPSYVKEHLVPRIFGFEIQMAPYSVCHLSLTLSLGVENLPKSAGSYIGVYFTNTLQKPNPVEDDSETFFARNIYKEAEAADKIKLEYPVMVVLGNPPYSGHSANNNIWIKSLLRGEDLSSPGGKATGSYFHIDGERIPEGNLKWLNDDYVKFIRFAQWRIETTGRGVIGFVTNHSWLDNPTFRGMRASLLNDFDEIYIVNLHGSAKKGLKRINNKIDENVFNIQQGVSILIFVRFKDSDNNTAKVYYSEIFGSRAEKYTWLENNNLCSTSWTRLRLVDPFFYFVPVNYDLEKEYNSGWSVNDIFLVSSPGIVTARDRVAIAPTADELKTIAQEMINLPEDEFREKYSIKKDSSEWKIEHAKLDLIEHSNPDEFIKRIFYRPFDTRVTWYSGKSKGFICRPRKRVMKNMISGKNIGLVTCRQQSQSEEWAHCSVTGNIVEACAVSNKSKEICHMFPLFLISSDDGMMKIGNGRHHNFDSLFCDELGARIGLKFEPKLEGLSDNWFGPDCIFYYIYSVLNCPSYRSRYSEFLMRDFPRVPFPSNVDFFMKLVGLGKQLVRLHMEKIDLVCGEPKFEYVGKDELLKETNVIKCVKFEKAGSGDRGRVWISQGRGSGPNAPINGKFFENVLTAAWNYRIGSYRPVEKWLKDRVGQGLGFADIERYIQICGLVTHSVEVMELIDKCVDEYGGWEGAVCRKIK